MTPTYAEVVFKHTKAAKALLSFVRRKNYEDCQRPQLKLVLLQLKANVIISDSWVPYYKQVEAFKNLRYPDRKDTSETKAD